MTTKELLLTDPSIMGNDGAEHEKDYSGYLLILIGLVVAIVIVVILGV